MHLKRILSILLIAIVFLIMGCDNKLKSSIDDTKEEINTMKMIINEKEYIIELEKNETVNSFIDMLQLELTMNELNGNEKYAYLDKKLPADPYNPKKINKGDVMLFGNNCLVIFYKSFNTSYSYTKIGHINNLPDLYDNNINVKIQK